MKDQAKEKVKELVERFRDKWIKYKYWIYCLILTLVVISIIYYVHPNECSENARYILSAISQGLAAILALVFTITLVVAQMTGGFSSMEKIVFRHDTIFLVTIHGIGIIAPLLVLNFGFWEWGVPLSIVIASFCVFSLLPFLIGIAGVLKYDIGIVNLNEEIMEAIESKNEAKAVRRIIKLESICKDATKESREYTTFEIICFLSEIGKKTIETGELRNATGNLIIGLGNIGIDAIERGFEDHISRFLATALSDLRIGAAKNTWDKEALLATYKLGEVGRKAIEKKKRLTADNVIYGLRYLGSLDDFTKFHQVNNSGFRALLCLGVLATEHLPDTDTVDTIIQNLKKNRIGMALFSSMNWEKYVIDKYPELGTSIKKFKERYEQV